MKGFLGTIWIMGTIGLLTSTFSIWEALSNGVGCGVLIFLFAKLGVWFSRLSAPYSV